ncbi:HVO_0476 family zinc finger protein [Methanosarcina sp.]|uniref:HVO_0476 family zinc finger protein n=1 Tax=Methanosarcina sp. TaxID=2213 RepID=UPI003C79321A
MTREIEVECPSCSPEEEIGHEVLKEGQSPLVRCLECGQVHAAKIKTPKSVTLRVIVSKMDVSNTYKTDLDSETMLQVDDELVVDDEETGVVVPILITALDAGGKRVQTARAENTETIWGRAIDEITVKFSAQSGTEKTEVIEKRVPGDYEFVVGAEEKVGNKRLFITKIKVRDGVFRSRKGDVVLAKYVKRIFARKKGEGSGQRDFRRGPW